MVTFWEDFCNSVTWLFKISYDKNSRYYHTISTRFVSTHRRLKRKPMLRMSEDMCNYCNCSYLILTAMHTEELVLLDIKRGIDILMKRHTIQCVDCYYNSRCKESFIWGEDPVNLSGRLKRNWPQTCNTDKNHNLKINEKKNITELGENSFSRFDKLCSNVVSTYFWTHFQRIWTYPARAISFFKFKIN